MELSSVKVSLYEPQCEKMYLLICLHNKDPAVHAHSLTSLHCLYEETLHPCYPKCMNVRANLNLHWAYIMKTYLYNFDPIKPHFYIVTLGFTGVNIIFLIFAQNIDCGYSLELPCQGSSNEYQQSMFLAEMSVFYLKIYSFWRWNFLYIWIGMFS